MRIALTFFLVIFASHHSYGQEKNTQTIEKKATFGAESFTLDNGLQVVVIPNDRAPIVTHMAWYKVGAADEPYGSSGLAHYLEHLMFKGTKTLAPGEFSTTVKKLGGNDNAFTSQDYTAYFQSIAKEHLETVMAMEADRMQNLNPPEDHFTSEKKVVIEERRQRTENDPRGLFGEQLRNALYVNHPYGLPVIGWMHEIERYEWGDVKTFYDIWYAPNNAILIISGDVTARDVKPIAERTYGKVPAKDIIPRMRSEIPSAIGEGRIVLKHPSIHQPAFQKIYLAPSAAQNKDHALALQVLNEILDGGATTRLYRSIVVDQKKASSVSLGYQSSAVDSGAIYVSGVPLEGVSLEELEALIEAEIQKIIQDGVTEQEVRDAIQRLQDAAIFARDSVAGPAMIFGRALTTGSTIEDIEYWAYDIGQITGADIQEVAKLYLNKDEPYIRPPVTGYMLPQKEGGVE